MEITLVAFIPIAFVIMLFVGGVTKVKGSIPEGPKCNWCQEEMRGTIYGEYNCKTCKDQLNSVVH